MALTAQQQQLAYQAFLEANRGADLMGLVQTLFQTLVKPRAQQITQMKAWVSAAKTANATVLSTADAEHTARVTGLQGEVADLTALETNLDTA